MGDRTYGKVEDYADGQLVVALGDEDLVTKKLADLQIAITGKEEDSRLRLALLTLGKDSLAKAAAGWPDMADLVRKATDAKWFGKQPHGMTLSDLDLLLTKLRSDFSSKYANWTPEIGKNRMISPVRGLPYISGCALDDPSQVGLEDPTDPELGPWPTPRSAKPGEGVRVGLLDTKLYPHPWFEGGYVATGDDLLEVPGADQQPPLALDGHATFIAGLILRQAPAACLTIRPVLGPRALGTTWGVGKMMAEFVGSGVDILNLSFGCYTDDGLPPLVLARAVNLLSPEILLVAAAGNHGNIKELRDSGKVTAAWTKHIEDRTPVWPAAFPEVIAVGATDDSGEVADFSPHVPWVNVTAPGVNVESTYLDGDVRLTSFPNDNKTFGGWARWRGTSFAAATVSGAVASKIKPGYNARQALDAVLGDSGQYREIVRFDASGPS